MKFCRFHSINLVLATIVFVVGKSALAVDSQHKDHSLSSGNQQRLTRQEQSTWRLEMLNDFMFDSDNQLTHGISLQRHYPVSPTLNELVDVRAIGKSLARHLLPQDSDLAYRRAFTIGQIMATPDNLSSSDIILNDAPYLGMLAMENSWIAFNDIRLTGFATTFGVVGEYSLAEELQTATHPLFDAEQPQGWHNQLDTEPIVNFYYMRKHKLWNKRSFDGAFTYDLSVGNFTTGIDAGIEMRFGRKPGGFSYLPGPIGREMSYDATLPSQHRHAEIYGTVAMRAWAWAVFMPLEGNTFVNGNEWTDNNTIEPKNIVGELIVGVHYIRPTWGLHASLTFATDNVHKESLRPGLGVENNHGLLTFEWRFGE